MLLRGEDISALPVHKRSTRLVWQNYALFPHLNVRRNIAFGLTLTNNDRADVRGALRFAAILAALFFVSRGLNSDELFSLRWPGEVWPLIAGMT